MLQDPGQDDHDADLEIHVPGLEDDPLEDRARARGTAGATSVTSDPGPDHRPVGVDAGTPEGESPDDCMPLDDEREQVGYELYDWEPSELDDLDDALHEAGLPHEWVSEGYEVVVHEDDEAAIDALLPTIRFPDELPPEEDDGDDTDVEVLSALFVAADRMVGHPTGDGVTAFLDAAERIGDRAPYGVEDAQWNPVVALVDELIDLFHAAGPVGEVVQLAERLRTHLRPLV